MKFAEDGIWCWVDVGTDAGRRFLVAELPEVVTAFHSTPAMCEQHDGREYTASLILFPQNGRTDGAHSTARVTNHNENGELRHALTKVARLANWFGWPEALQRSVP